MISRSFTLSHYRFHLTPCTPLALPAVKKGNTIRGAFGTILRRLVCIDLDLECDECR